MRGRYEGNIMRYLFLRGNRNKRFFIDIANELNKRGHQCYQLQFELGELIVPTGTLKTVFAPWHISKEEYPISNQQLLAMQIYNIAFTERILKKSITEKELQMYKRYMYYIDTFIEKHQIDIICMFNGYHWIDQTATFIAKKRGLKTYYFEDGLFRPYTITVDPKGINDESSVPRSPDFYDSLPIDKERLKHHLFTPENKDLIYTKENLLKVAFVKGLSMLGNFLNISPTLYVHTTFWQSVKYVFFKYRFKYQKADELNLASDYIFIPFQVSRDTQIFYNSPNISSMEQLLDIAFHAVNEINNELNRNIKIIVKEHPEDMSRNNYRDLKEKYKNNNKVIFVEKYNIKQLIKHALIVLTINSTAGIEALAQYKKVVTMGNALYNIQGIAFHCETPDRLKNVLTSAINSQYNLNRIEKFIYYLRFDYQVEGTINRTSNVTAINVANKMEEGRE